MTYTLAAPVPRADASVAETGVRRARRATKNRVCLGLLLAATAVGYLWNITINGMANQYYAASVQAGSRDGEALLFGSLDANNFITVDKPPLSQWVMGLSGQLFGFSSASMLIPQALMAVAGVALLYGAVRRIGGPGAGLLAGAALALTPVAVLMFRFNDPDAAMVLLMTAAAYCTVRALDRGSVRWLAAAGVALGFAFLAKMLEGVMVMPALAVVYLHAAPVRWRVRLLHLAGAAVAFVVSAGWFVALTMVWPAASRPYIAGSTDNSFMNLVLGYNGLARVLGHHHFDVGMPSVFGASVSRVAKGAANLGGFGGESVGASRLFTGEFGVEIGWLLPAAVVATVLTVVVRGRAPRTDRVRAGAVLFGGWLLIDGSILSYMHGTIHPYYSLSVAPPVAAVFAIGVQQTWARRESPWCRLGLGATLLTAGGWAWWLLGGSAIPSPALRWTILVVTALASAALLWSWTPRGGVGRRRVAPALLAAALIGALGGPTAYSVATVGAMHQGIGPSVGPPHPGFGGNETVGNPRLDALLEATDTPWSAAIDRSFSAASLELATGTAVMAIGGFSGTDPAPTLQQFQRDVAGHRVAYYLAPRGASHGEVADGVHGEDVSPRAHSDILRWVQSHFHSTTIGGLTAYDLLEPRQPGATSPGAATAWRR